MIETRETMTAQRSSQAVACAACDDAHADRPQRRSDLILHEIDGEALLFDPQTQSTHRFNETGFLIWSLCDGTTGVDQIAVRLSEVYAVDRAEAECHVVRLVGALRRHGLLVATPQSPSQPSVVDRVL